MLFAEFTNALGWKRTENNVTSRRTQPKSLSGYIKSRRLVLRIIRLFAIGSEKPKLPQGKPAGFIVPRGLSGGVQRVVSEKPRFI